jgi:phosphinothricin acetyltransferase
MQVTIEQMVASDWPAVAAIYQEGIDTGDATFEDNVPTWEQFDDKHLPDCRLVARVGADIVGWIALSPVSTRCVYAGVAEVSVYVKAAARGRGIGQQLLTEAIEASEQAGLWTLQAGIFPENAASLALHKRCGFRLVGYRERLGHMNGQWRDVVLLERRSEVAGV